jgi:hypothetical protein
VPAARAGYHTAAWIAGGVAIAGAASAVTFWALARRRWDDLRDRCAGPCPASEGGAIDRGRFYQTMTNASWIVAGVGAAGALGLAIAAHRADTTEVSVAVSPAGLIVAGAF